MKANRIKSIVSGMALIFLGASQLFSQSVIVNEASAVTALDKAALKDLLLGKTLYWQGSQ